MTPNRDPDRLLRAWLDLMPDEAPDHAIAAVLQATERAPQKRDLLGPALRRFSPMNRVPLAAAAAVILVVVAGGALLFRPGSNIGGPPTSSPTPTPTPTATTSTTPGTSAEPPPAPEAIRGNWIADASTGTIIGDLEEPLQFVVNGPGSSAWVRNPAGNYAFSSSPRATAADEVTFSLDRDGWECSTGALGRYRWAVSQDDVLLTLTALDDECVGRATALTRTWTRTHNGYSRGGTALVTGLGPLISVTLPAGTYTQRPLTDVVELADNAMDLGILIFRDPQPFVDPCRSGLQPWQPGARAFIDALQRNPAMSDFTEEALEVGGYPAIHLTLRARSDYPPCEPDHPFFQWTPRADPGGQWWLSAGDPDSIYLIDHPDATLLFQGLPIGSPDEDAIVSSISFPSSLQATP